jgi:hypothetical protein
MAFKRRSRFQIIVNTILMSTSQPSDHFIVTFANRIEYFAACLSSPTVGHSLSDPRCSCFWHLAHCYPVHVTVVFLPHQMSCVSVLRIHASIFVSILSRLCCSVQNTPTRLGVSFSVLVMRACSPSGLRQSAACGLHQAISDSLLKVDDHAKMYS